MSDQDMITAITNSINTSQANLLIAIQVLFTASLASIPAEQLQNLCNALGIDTSGS